MLSLLFHPHTEENHLMPFRLLSIDSKKQFQYGRKKFTKKVKHGRQTKSIWTDLTNPDRTNAAVTQIITSLPQCQMILMLLDIQIEQENYQIVL